MASRVLFISCNRLKQDTAMGGSVEDDLLRPHILMAQTKYILPVLGTDLYNALQTKIAGKTVGTGAYQTLLQDYVQPALVHYAFAVALPFIRVRVSNHHVGIMTSEQSSPASIQDVRQLTNASLDVANFSRERLIDYLLHNQADFPEYTSNSGADLVPQTRNYTQGLNLEPTYRDLDREMFAATIGAKHAI